MHDTQVHQSITQEDVEMFACRLTAWAGTLAPQERQMLADLVAVAAAAEGGEVRAYASDIGPYGYDRGPVFNFIDRVFEVVFPWTPPPPAPAIGGGIANQSGRPVNRLR